MDVFIRELVFRRCRRWLPVASVWKDGSILLIRFVAACRAQTQDVSVECSLAKSGVVTISIISCRILWARSTYLVSSSQVSTARLQS